MFSVEIYCVYMDVIAPSKRTAVCKLHVLFVIAGFRERVEFDSFLDRSEIALAS